MAATLDTLTAARRLKEAGATDEIAEAIVETIRDAREFDLAQLATEADLRDAELRLLKWIIGIDITAVVTITGALTGVIWAATQVILHARP
jgi:hypothetical protein